LSNLGQDLGILLGECLAGGFCLRQRRGQRFDSGGSLGLRCFQLDQALGDFGSLPARAAASLNADRPV
jgi:hypothetical protein